VTARVVLSCDGEWHGNPCRGAIPVGAVTTGSEARWKAAKEGWTAGLVAFPPKDYQPKDYCPACTKRRQEGRS
jgi:hypothetical protein